MQIGYLGLGAMGGALARRLQQVCQFSGFEMSHCRAGVDAMNQAGHVASETWDIGEARALPSAHCVGLVSENLMLVCATSCGVPQRRATVATRGTAPPVVASGVLANA